MQTKTTLSLPLAAACLLWLAWLMPNHYLPWTSFYGETAAAIGAAFLVGAALHAGASRAFVPFASLALLGLSLVPWIQWLGGLIIFKGDAALAQTYLAGAALCWWAGGAMVGEEDSQRRLRGLAWLLVTAGIASTAVALYQWFGLTGMGIWAVDADPGRRAMGNLAQSNHLATLLLCGVFATVWLNGTGRLGRMGALPLSLFLLVGIALAQSRTAWLATLVVLAWTFVRSRAIGHHLIRPVTAAVFIAGFSALHVLTVYAPEWLLMNTEMPNMRLEAGLRPILWKQMVAAIQMAPWQGFGWMQIHTAQGAVAPMVPGLEYSAYAHNLFLDLILWNGLPIGVAAAAGLAWWYFKMSWAVRDEGQWLRWAILTCIGTHAMLEYPHTYAYALLPFAFVAGQMESMAGLTRGVQVPRPVIGAVAVAVFATVIAVMHDYVQVENEGRLLRMKLAHIQGLESAGRTPDTWVLDQMRETVRMGHLELRAGMDDQALSDLLRISRRFPNRFFLPRAIIALQLNNKPAQALEELARFRGIHGPEAYASLLRSFEEMANGDTPALMPLVKAAPR
ncbi:PglL family O-oligosaccharyltransferase [Piscinibacter terrae]|uniref:O-antigen ligase n=1 Tax=Piscinibacter terrae TaxID=2496871 RepID=A0A3N7HQM0_9BURK|nr:O-antigen ligase family protein [Albitalea terrae]RQP24494.1 hypothetical protein DZC73_14510 [Albitalea terrae]